MDYGSIDGTANLVKQQEDYCIIIAYFVDGEPKLSYIYDYPHDKLYKSNSGEGAFVNGQQLMPPNELKLQRRYYLFWDSIYK